MMNYNFTINNSDLAIAERVRFCEEVSINTITEKRDFALNLAGESFLTTVIKTIKDLTGQPVKVMGVDPGIQSLYVKSNNSFLVQIVIGGSGYLYEQGRHNFNVFATGDSKCVKDFFDALFDIYGNTGLATVTWWFNTKQATEYRVTAMEPPLSVYDEFYPWLDGGVNKYLQRFLDDRAAVLFMMGEPGTGKTSLVRHMIYEHCLSAVVTYEEALLSEDQIFVDFLCNPNKGVLLIEDSDLMVGSRESDGNKLISRFLNVSDGLIKTSDKKIIFTTNLGDFRHIDRALVRPGRCFDAIKFRALTFEEAKRAARAAGIAPPTESKSYTLADLFVPKNKALELTSMGF